MHEGDSLHFLVGGIGALFVGAANPFAGLVMVKTFKTLFVVDPDQVRRECVIWCILLVVTAVCQIGGDVMRGWGFSSAGEKLTKKFRILFYNALVRQEIGWHDLPDNASGALCASLATEVNTIQALSGETLGRNVATVLTLVVAFGIAFTFGYWAVVLVSLACVPLMMSGMAIEFSVLAGDEQATGMAGDAGKVVGEVLTSIRTISSFTMEQAMQERYEKSEDAHVNKEVPKGAMLGIVQGYSQGALFCSFALMFWYGGVYLGDDNLPQAPFAEDKFEGMFIPIFCMFMLGAGLGQATQGATDTGKAAKVDSMARVHAIVKTTNFTALLRVSHTFPQY